MARWPNFEERIADRLMPEPNSGCLIWLGVRDVKGYGRVRHGGRMRYVHPVLFELTYGPLPRGHEPDHLCRNRACANVRHMEGVSHRVNVLRGQAPHAANAIKAVCKRGHSLVGSNVRLRKDGRECLTCKIEADRVRYERRKREEGAFWRKRAS